MSSAAFSLEMFDSLRAYLADAWVPSEYLVIARDARVEIERLQKRESDLLRANNEELERRRAAERRAEQAESSARIYFEALQQTPFTREPARAADQEPSHAHVSRP